jgi:flagellar protein FliL
MRTIFLLCLGVLLAAGSAQAEDDDVSVKRAVYYDMQPPFVANFGVSTKKMPYVKAEVALRVADEAAATLVRRNEPLIRHQIVMLLSKQTRETMATSAAQESLRSAALIQVKEVMSKELGVTGIDDLLFTNFVVQL